jgi:hypothetical protein
MSFDDLDDTARYLLRTAKLSDLVAKAPPGSWREVEAAAAAVLPDEEPETVRSPAASERELVASEFASEWLDD